MDQKGINLIDRADFLDWDPEELSNQALEDIIDIARVIEHKEESNHRSKAVYWFHRMPECLLPEFVTTITSDNWRQGRCFTLPKSGAGREDDSAQTVSANWQDDIGERISNDERSNGCIQSSSSP